MNKKIFTLGPNTIYNPVFNGRLVFRDKVSGIIFLHLGPTLPEQWGKYKKIIFNPHKVKEIQNI